MSSQLVTPRARLPGGRSTPSSKWAQCAPATSYQPTPHGELPCKPASRDLGQTNPRCGGRITYSGYTAIHDSNLPISPGNPAPEEIPRPGIPASKIPASRACSDLMQPCATPLAGAAAKCKSARFRSRANSKDGIKHARMEVLTRSQKNVAARPQCDQLGSRTFPVSRRETQFTPGLRNPFKGWVLRSSPFAVSSKTIQ
jgi:hypothetical protein